MRNRFFSVGVIHSVKGGFAGFRLIRRLMVISFQLVESFKNLWDSVTYCIIRQSNWYICISK